ncbi:MAG: ATP synthase subunit I [Gammaproteobacteria bacterium]
MSFESINRQTARQARGYIIAQLAATSIVSAILLGLYWPNGWTAAYSAFAGGLIATLANAWFALKIFGGRSSDRAEVVLRRFYWGELNKILFTCAMFVAAFVLIRPVNAAALLAVYFFVHMTPAVVNIFSRRK